ncbi:MAG TPA: SDR family NAD(P)-dependent oxidoreductase, partial [Dehalococcoidia bacterium]|nr:SDR family NAD(P)-dependent oxidoreductase [Dehalococcoidia bacterium]
MNMDFEGKTVLITGSGSGIGKSAANRFANGGANLVLADINKRSLEETCEEIRASGRNVISVELDVGNLDEIDLMVEKAMSEFNGIDVLFNNAGLTRHISFLDIEEQHWDQIHRVNSKGAFFCMQKTARTMV